MAKSTVTINGKKVTIDTNKAKVADAVAALIKAVGERQFSIGMPILKHANGDSYLLARVKYGSGYKALLMNTRTGVARRSDKLVIVQEPDGGGENGRGYVTDLPCKKDRFYDPENSRKFIECDEYGRVL